MVTRQERDNKVTFVDLETKESKLVLEHDEDKYEIQKHGECTMLASKKRELVLVTIAAA